MVGGNTHIAEISYDHCASASGKNRYSSVPRCFAVQQRCRQHALAAESKWTQTLERSVFLKMLRFSHATSIARFSTPKMMRSRGV